MDEFACPQCDAGTPAAASFCGRCGARLRRPGGLSCLKLDKNRRATSREITPIYGIDPWALGADGRFQYIFHAVDRALRISQVDVCGGDGAPTGDLGVSAPTHEARGLAVTRRGAFVATASEITGVLAPTGPNGWTRHRIGVGAQIVGFAGVGGALLVACFDAGRLTLRRSLGENAPVVVAGARWTNMGPPGWLRIFADPRSDVVWLWGQGALVRVDMAIGEMQIRAAADAPVGDALPLLDRASNQVVPELPRPEGFAGVAPAPLAGGGWAILNLTDGALARLSEQSAQSPLAIAPGRPDQSVLAVYGSFLLHAEIDGGAVRERRMPFPPLTSAALAGGDGRVVALVRGHEDASLTLLEIELAPKEAPLLRSQTALQPDRFASTRPERTLPPVVVGELKVAALAGDRLMRWSCPLDADGA